MSFIDVLRAAGRTVLPWPVRAAIRKRFFTSLDLNWQMPSGIRLRIEQYSDWTIYNEIFVRGDYDEAIGLAIDRCHDTSLRVVDLGANAGFFTLRVFDRWRERKHGDELIKVKALEADPAAIDVFRSRVFADNHLESKVELLRGLAGRKSGFGQLVLDCWGKRAARGTLPFLDLSPIFDSTESIGLIKCDIEGAEQDFIENYAGLLTKTQVVVFEFHRQRSNVNRCLELLRSYGFIHESSRRPEAEYPLYSLWR